MTIYGGLIAAFWLALIIVWLAAAGRARRTIGGGRTWQRELGLRAALAVFILLALSVSGARHALSYLELYAVERRPVAGLIGVMLCALGVGLAILARFYLGRNWGLPMTRKENPELVTAGPYAVIRHPIYTGMLLAMLGSAIGQSIFWALPLILSGPYFIYSAWREESLMAAQFPDQYPAYVKRTKMLLPYLL